MMLRRGWLLLGGLLVLLSVGFGPRVRSVYVLDVHRTNGTSFISDTYGSKRHAVAAARRLPADPSTWVLVTTSRFHE